MLPFLTCLTCLTPSFSLPLYTLTPEVGVKYATPWHVTSLRLWQIHHTPDPIPPPHGHGFDAILSTTQLAPSFNRRTTARHFSLPVATAACTAACSFLLLLEKPQGNYRTSTFTGCRPLLTHHLPHVALSLIQLPFQRNALS